MSAALSDAQIYSAVVAAGFSGTSAVVMTAICLAESSGIPDNVGGPNHNGTYDYGLAQINSSHTALLQGGNWRDPVSNLKMAHTLYVAAGNKFTPWSTYNSGAYVSKLARAQAASGKTVPVPGAGAAASGGFTVENADNQSKTTSDFQSKVDAATAGGVWLRIGYFVAGAVLLLIVAISMIKNTSLGGAAIHAAKIAAVG